MGPFYIGGSFMKELKFDKEFEKLIPSLTNEEFEQLEKNCIENGIQDSIKVWNGFIIDGHNRYNIAKKNNLDFNVDFMEFENRSNVIEWMLVNQLGRRNLNKYERSVIALKLEDLYKLHGKENMCLSGSEISPSLNTKKHDTRKKIADKANVSDNTISKVKHIEEKADPETKEKLKSGDITINKAYQGIKNPHVINNSGDNEWYTPKQYIESARLVMGSIDLDPATSIEANKIVNAEKIYTIDDNGLNKKWFGNVWLNPPYSSNLISSFIDKLVNSLYDINQFILLVNNATDTQWFHKIINYSDSFCFPKGRIKFYKIDNDKKAPLQGQVLLYCGNNSKKFIKEFCKYGWCNYNEKRRNL